MEIAGTISPTDVSCAVCLVTGASDSTASGSNADFQRKMMPLDHLFGPSDLPAGMPFKPCITAWLTQI